MKASEVAARAAEQLAALSGRTGETVTAIERTDDLTGYQRVRRHTRGASRED